MKVKKESEKAGLKLNFQKTKIMASGSITSWQIDGETVRDFIFLGSKVTADGVTLMSKSKKEIRTLLLRVKKESEKAGLKLNIQKTTIMAFSLTTSTQIEGEKFKAGTDFIFLGSKITANK